VVAASITAAAPTAHATSYRLAHSFRQSVGDSFGISVGAVGATSLVVAQNPAIARAFDAAGGALLRTFATRSPAERSLTAILGCHDSVVAVGNNILIGAPGDDVDGTDAGAAYLFDGTTGTLLRSFRRPDAAAGVLFGCSVAALGDDVLVGAPLDRTGATVAGAVYLFDGATGSLLRVFGKPNPATGDLFGWSVAAVGNDVLVGAPFDSTGATRAGAAYLFDGATGSLLNAFGKPNPASNDLFGWSVASMGDNVLVGAPGDNLRAPVAGAAYLFDGTTAGLLLTFPNPTSTADGQFGWSVAGVGGEVLVGAPGVDAGAANAGAAYLFDGATGVLLQSFEKPNAAVDDQFGSSVASVGTNILVGAPGDDTEGDGAGAAYLFDRSGNLLQTLTAGHASGDQFGLSIAAAGSNVLIGAPFDDAGDAGLTYLFDGTSGGLLRTFANPTPATGDQFGFSVVAVGANVLVGAPFDDMGAKTDTGAAYIFNGTTGELLKTLAAPAPAAGDQFGFSVAAAGHNLIVGAPGDDTAATDAGAAYLFDASGSPVRTFLAPDAAEGDQFGAAVAALGDDVLVAAPLRSTQAINAGAVYLLSATSGNLIRTFAKATPAAGDLFGAALAIGTAGVLVGAPLDDTGGNDAGVVYLFDRDTGNLLRTFQKSVPVPGDRFGTAVAFVRGGTQVLVGAPGDDLGAEDAGAVYLFDAATGAMLQGFPNPVPHSGDRFGFSVAGLGNDVLAGAPLADRFDRRSGGPGLQDTGVVHLFTFCAPDCPAGCGNGIVDQPGADVQHGAADACEAPTVIATVPFTDETDTTAATTSSSDPDQSCPFNGPRKDSNSVWYSFTPASAGTATVDTSGSGYDTVVTAYTGPCGHLREIACNDDISNTNRQSAVSIPVSGGTRYLLEVTDFDEQPGGGRLVFTLDGDFSLTPEQCDDGNLTDGDGCDSNCTLTTCGNGIRTDPEGCDGADDAACPAQCRPDCTCFPCSGPGELTRLRPLTATAATVASCCVGVPPGVECDDGNACTVGDKCDAQQSCVGQQRSCDDGIPCTDDSCDPQSGCIYTPDDSKCQDSDPCTDDICDPNDGCIHPRLPNCTCSSNDQCDNRNPCDGVERCIPCDGCSFVHPWSCCRNGGAPVCRRGARPHGTSCPVADPCTVDPTCQAGSCVGTPKPCPASDECHVRGACDHDTGACTNPPKNCDDGTPCTRDTCNPQVPGGCIHDTSGCGCDRDDTCNRGNPCTTGTCSNGTCVNAPRPNGALCADADPCNGEEVCQNGQCVHATSLSCFEDLSCRFVGDLPLDCPTSLPSFAKRLNRAREFVKEAQQAASVKVSRPLVGRVVETLKNANRIVNQSRQAHRISRTCASKLHDRIKDISGHAKTLRQQANPATCSVAIPTPGDGG